jgi:hypothetical protein
MIEELQRRDFADSTIRSYVHGVEHFSKYFGRRPDRLGPRHIRQYQATLSSKRGHLQPSCRRKRRRNLSNLRLQNGAMAKNCDNKFDGA